MSDNLNTKIQKLILSKKFYIKRKTVLNKRDLYWKVKKDPDGNLRNRLTNYEKKKFIKNNQLLIKEIKKYNVKNILDIGCGPGFLLSALNKKKYNLYGLENDKLAIKFAEKYGSILKHNLNGKPVNFKTKFDLIIANQVIEHINKPENLINFVKNNLKKKGIFIVGTPDFDCIMSRFYKKKFRLLHDKTHVSLFSRDSIVRFLNHHGFEILKLDFPYFDTDYFLEFKNKNIKNIFNLKNKVSPPFYGNIINITARLKN